MPTAVKARAKRPERVLVSESNIKKAATRLLAQNLVSSEIHYVQRTLGNSATQGEVDAQVMAVRKMPWSSIVLPD